MAEKEATVTPIKPTPENPSAPVGPTPVPPLPALTPGSQYESLSLPYNLQGLQGQLAAFGQASSGGLLGMPLKAWLLGLTVPAAAGAATVAIATKSGKNAMWGAIGGG